MEHSFPRSNRNTVFGANNRLFVQSSGDDSILELDCFGPVFEGPLRTVHTSMDCWSMCYIPHPTNALVLSDFYSSSLVAKSTRKNEIIWEFQDKKGGMMTGLLFSPEHKVLLVPNGTNGRVLIVNAENMLLACLMITLSCYMLMINTKYRTCVCPDKDICIHISTPTLSKDNQRKR